MTWWKISRELGARRDYSSDNDSRAHEALQEAARDLPGEAWKNVDTVPIAVALPRARPDSPEGSPLGADGLFCIGLPTEMPTGTPFWLHSHFHGNISRTEIDLKTQPYNELLFEEGMHLLRDLLDRLRRADHLDDRRLVTLAMEDTSGPIQEDLYKRHTAVVLAADGKSYVNPSDICLPGPDDYAMLQWLLPAGDEAADYGFVLPEEKLLTSGRDVLEGLTGKSNPAKEALKLFLQRKESDKSLIERGAEAHRHDGSPFWNHFLRWLHDRFTVEELGDQRILPVGSSGLLAPNDRVFFAPQRGGLDIFEQLGDDASLPDLPFLDNNAVSVRKDGGDYTELATKLAPERGPQLVRRPVALDLINDAAAPYLRRALSDLGDPMAALAGLRLVLRLTDQITGETRARIRRKDLLVPIGDPGSPDNWIPPTDAYLGPGWVDEETDALLNEAYGGEARRLIPWSRFESFIEGTEDKQPWLERMQALGVDAAPKIRKPGRNRRAPLKSHSRKRLTRDDSVDSPLPELEDIWRNYLEDVRHRPARTTSGQAYDLDEVVWIDGLEIPHARRSVVKLVLLHARRYQDKTETILGRVQNVRNRDRKSVPTMWIHALRSSNWRVVPTTQGLVPPSDAWIVQDSSYLSFRILPVVSDRYRSADAELLLKKMGASSIRSANISELVHALHYVAERIDDLSTEDRKSAAVLTKDLYRDIQARLGEDEEREQLDIIVDQSVPLLRDDLEAVDLKQIDTLYLNDDPVRARFIPGLEDAPKIPTRAGRTYGRLVDELRRVLGDDRVQRTSTAEVETGFEPLDESKSRLLRGELDAISADRNIALDLAAIVAYRGPTPLDPHAERFQQLWDEFERTQVHRGVFPADVADIDAFYDSQGSGRPVLQISSDLEPAAVLAATWQIFGEGYRDVIELYAGKISQSQAIREFFVEREVSTTDFQRLREVVEGAAEAELERAKSLGLVLARRRNPDLSVRSFESQWDASAISSADLPLAENSLESLRGLGRAIQRHDEPRMLEVLAELDVSVEEWQTARRELGHDLWRFRITAEVFIDKRKELEAELMALAARRPSIDSDHSHTLVSRLREAEAPLDLLYASPSDRKCRETALSIALSLTREEDLLTRRLRGELEMGEDLVPDDVPDREVTEFRQTPQRLRQRRAHAFLGGVLDLAEALAEAKDENLDGSEVSSYPRISLLSQGWLANHYALAPVLRDSLAEQAPETAEALVKAGAFRDRIPKSELWQRFPELDSADQSHPEPQREFDLLGEGWGEQRLKEDLALASEGSIGAEMRDRASGEVDLRGMAGRDREPVSDGQIESGSSSSSGGGGGGTTRSSSRRARELNGLLGEVFVFEQLRQSLPGFDSTCWISENRSHYGHEHPGSDSEGHDFLYTDAEGMLTPNEGARCEIEVKSTSSAEPVEFNLTQNEMNRARQCHQNENREFVIIWVANVRESPVIRDVLVDPINLWKRGLIDIRARGGRKVKVPVPEAD